MRLYSGSSQQFIQDTVRNQIADKLKSAFFQHYRFNPSQAEVRSWQNSLRAISQTIDHASLYDHGILLEYQLPLSSRRLDCMVCGHDESTAPGAVIVELKQWEGCEEADGENEVLTWIGGREREVLHPSVQVCRYQTYLQDVHPAFYDPPDPISLSACSYLHNYQIENNDILVSPKFFEITRICPTFGANNYDELTGFLSKKLAAGDGLSILRRIEESRYRPSKKLMEHVAQVIHGHPDYILLDEQLVVYDKVLAYAKKGFHDRNKVVLIVKGGPGTGKSVIAINLMADLLQMGYNAHYATGSKAFTETLRKAIGSRGAPQFKYFNSYTSAEQDMVDVLICDESHRLRESSHSMYTPKSQRIRRSNTKQVEELLTAARVTVFFIDDKQVVRPNEIGSVAHIKEFARRRKCLISEYKLEVQFRCSGSEAFVNWIDNTLGIEKTPNVLLQKNENFDFKIFDSPENLEKAIQEKANQGYTARMTAGFCWKWSRKPGEDGTLKEDVVIGEYRRPWNARHDATRLAENIPKAHLWAYDPRGIDQIGCIYTAQGFEFDYVGVIFGNDLYYDYDEQQWRGRSQYSADHVVKRSKDKFVDLVKNTYRVLLSRGMKGCYVYFLDKETEMFFKSRME